MKLRNLIYPIIASAILYGCAQTETERIESCAKVSRRVDYELREDNLKKKNAFPDMNFACERRDDDYSNRG